METKSYEQLLQQKGLKRTKVRLALIQHFINRKHAQSYNDLQAAFAKELDKSTLYRNLASFEQAGIIHRIDNHSGMAKYALGKSHMEGKGHAHFVCESCETVYCMEETSPPQPNVPEGFQTNYVQTIIKGICSNC